jgi:hypothetical protein
MSSFDNHVANTIDDLNYSAKKNKTAVTILRSIPPLGKMSAINQEHLYTVQELLTILNICSENEKEFKEILEDVFKDGAVQDICKSYYSLQKIIASTYLMEKIPFLSHFWAEPEEECPHA